jgi:uncharacterized MAPEG superfamily protein
MNSIHLVAMLAVLQYIFFSALVGRARDRYGVKAPAVTGHEGFERAYRVQMNTLELLIAFIPALYAAGWYWPSWIVAIAGGVFILGRFIYWRAYISNPLRRGLGFILSIVPTMALALAGMAGAIRVGMH